MTGRTRGRLALAAAVGLAGLAVVFQAMIVNQARSPRTAGGACAERTICDEASAIAAAYQELSHVVTVTESVARLVTMGQARDLLSSAGGSIPDEKPIWFVGLRTRVIDDAYPMAAWGSDPDTDGVYCVLVASGGGTAFSGGLASPGDTSPTGITFAEIEALVDQPLVIVSPTGFPTVTPVVVPTPEYVP